MLEVPALARLTGVGRVFVKAEGNRPLGSFKALGGMIAGLRALAKEVGTEDLRELCSTNVCRALRVAARPELRSTYELAADSVVLLIATEKSASNDTAG